MGRFISGFVVVEFGNGVFVPGIEPVLPRVPVLPPILPGLAEPAPAPAPVDPLPARCANVGKVEIRRRVTAGKRTKRRSVQSGCMEPPKWSEYLTTNARVNV
jgi:hypothetical protein